MLHADCTKGMFCSKERSFMAAYGGAFVELRLSFFVFDVCLMMASTKAFANLSVPEGVRRIVDTRGGTFFQVCIPRVGA